jgi:hypothetical protein
MKVTPTAKETTDMTLLSGLVATGSLLLTLALLPVPGGVLFAPFTFGLFVLALAGVLAGREDLYADRGQPQPRREAEAPKDLDLAA